MNMYKEIDQETMELLLDALLKRTLEGKQIWENLYYNPIGFVKEIFSEALATKRKKK